MKSITSYLPLVLILISAQLLAADVTELTKPQTIKPGLIHTASISGNTFKVLCTYTGPSTRQSEKFETQLSDLDAATIQVHNYEGCVGLTVKTLADKAVVDCQGTNLANQPLAKLHSHLYFITWNYENNTNAQHAADELKRAILKAQKS